MPPHLLKANITEDSDTDQDTVGPSAVAGPQIPPGVQLPTTLPDDEEDEEDAYVPALPPDLRAKSYSSNPPQPHSQPRPPNIIGPSFPSRIDYDSDDDAYGPMPLPSGAQLEEKDGVDEVLEREERMKKAAEEAAKPKALKREEWMLVPPSSSDMLGSLDPTKLKARQFSRKATTARDADNTLWTETPQERTQRLADEVAGKKRRAANAEDGVPSEADARKRQRKEEEIRRGISQYNTNLRGQSLLDTHAKARAVAPKEKDESQSAIWDHERDMSLGGRLMDDKKRTQMIRESKGLGDRFSSGRHGGYL